MPNWVTISPRSSLQYLTCSRDSADNPTSKQNKWASIIKELIPEDAVWIKISKDLEKGFDYRRIDIDGLDIEI